MPMYKMNVPLIGETHLFEKAHLFGNFSMYSMIFHLFGNSPLIQWKPIYSANAPCVRCMSICLEKALLLGECHLYIKSPSIQECSYIRRMSTCSVETNLLNKCLLYGDWLLSWQKCPHVHPLGESLWCMPTNFRSEDKPYDQMSSKQL